MEWRNFVRGAVICRMTICGALILILPASLMAQDSDRAMLHSSGGAWLNGNPAPSSTAIFLHDIIQTQQATTAKIDADGSTVTVHPDTIVQFEGNELVLDHGTLQVITSHAMRVRVNCITVIPVTQEWTHYDVTDVDGRVTVVAEQSDARIHERGAAARRSKQGEFSDVIVHQGERKSRDERCGAAAKPADVVDGHGAILNSIWAKGASLAVVGALTCWALCRGDDPISPDKP